jgi:hypothetical protein
MSIFSEHVKDRMEHKASMLGYENMNMLSNYQFSCGDQSKESRNTFAETDFKICPKCNSSEIELKHDIANCRMNGDAYGTDVFICKSCNWITSFYFDEGGDSPYYYEIIYFDYYKEKWAKIQEE